MRVIVVHNRYRSKNPSGENAVVDLEVELLQDAGVQVAVLERSSDEIATFSRRDRMSLALQPIHSAASIRRVRELIQDFKPDVLHLHNPYPLISPSVLKVARTAGVATVATVHNYRLVCANGLFFRDGRPCHDCQRSTLPYPAVLHACYRDSRPQSAVLSTALVAHRKTWNTVDRFVALSSPMRDFLLAYGIPNQRIALKPNTVRDPGPPLPVGSGFLFAGRLSVEKGIELLIEAWNRHPVGSLGVLRICGDGELRDRVGTWAAGRADVDFKGQRSEEEVSRLIDETAVVVIPSIWEEPFGLAAVEAMAHGRPVLASDSGALPELVGNQGGWVVKVNADSWAAGLGVAAKGTEEYATSARARYVQHYSPTVATRLLLATYEAAITASAGRAA
jgi:glycosyltransferase involved in cell wall biosynthesis